MPDIISSDDEAPNPEGFERPRSINKLKRDAKRLKRELGITHTEALNIVAQRHGYRDYRHAKAELSPDDEEECV